MNSVLIVRLGSLGDVVHAIPAAAALRDQYPHLRIDWLVDPQYVPLLELVESVDHAISLNPRDAGGGTVATVRALRATGYDAVIDLQGLLKSAVLARAAGGRRTIGFPSAHLRERAARFFYTETPDPGPAVHVVYKNLALLRSLGVVSEEARFPLNTPRSPIVRGVVERAGAGRYLLLNPGAAWPNKRWPPARFGAVASALASSLDLRSLVLWGPGEQSLAEEVARASDGAAEPLPPTTIVDILGIARDARLMVSGDTGPLHLAGAAGTPIVSLFGPTRPERNGPWSASDVALSRVAECSCLYERRCRRDTPCIDSITVDEVVQAVRRRLGSC